MPKAVDTPKVMDTLVLSGGGTKGIAFIGVLQYLQEHHLYAQITRFVGTSIGSLVCALCALDYELNDITHLIHKLDFSKIVNISLDTLLDFHTTFGIDNGESLTKLIKILIKKKTGNANTTFQQLYQLTHKHLTVTGTCLNSCQAEYYNHLQTPNMAIYKAIRISTCFPFFFKSFVDQGKHYVDGGVSDHYPIAQFPSDTTLGVLIEDSSYDNRKCIGDLSTFLSCIVQSFFKNVQDVLLNRYKDNTIFIDIKEATSMNFNLEKKCKTRWIQLGFESAATFFKNRKTSTWIEDAIDHEIRTAMDQDDDD